MAVEKDRGANPMKLSHLAVTVASLTVWGAAAHAAQLLNDGSFEGNFADNWSKAGSGNASKQSGAAGNIGGAYDGTSYARVNSPNGAGNNGATEAISQTFADVSGDIYKVVAYVSTIAPAIRRTSSWSIDIDSVSKIGDDPSVSEGWTKETFTFIGTGLDTISLIGDNSSTGVFTYFDDVSVKGAAPGGVPEPASWALAIVGMGLTGAALRQRRQAVA
jgi:hypothetical protein